MVSGLWVRGLEGDGGGGRSQGEPNREGLRLGTWEL